VILKQLAITNCFDNNNDQSPNTKSHTLGGMINHKSNNSLLSCYHKKIIDLVPLKSIQDLFTNHNIVKIDENGLCESSNKNEINCGKVLFNININENSQINNNYLKLDNKENSNVENNTIYLSNKINPKINKSASIFSIHYNKITNNFILTSFTDDIFFALEIWSNRNLYIEHSKRYYVQLSDIFISLKSNNVDKKITIKILNIKNEENDNDVKNKYIFDFNKVPITIGRNNCSINIEKNSISKTHLIINYDVNINQFFLRDNFSTNGSFILLKNGKEVTLADKMFFFLEKEHFTLKM
jgi:hypothetical protein